MTIENRSYRSTKQPSVTRKSLDQDVILNMLDQGEAREAVDVLSLTHDRLGKIMSFRLDKIDQNEREAVISHNWAERARNEIAFELQEQLKPQ